jgi:hypothetical protein
MSQLMGDAASAGFLDKTCGNVRRWANVAPQG